MLAESSLLPWSLFLAFIGVMLALDLGVFHQKAHLPSFKEALAWTTVWALLAIGFGAWIHHAYGSRSCVEFFTGHVLEMYLPPLLSLGLVLGTLGSAIVISLFRSHNS